MSTGIPGHVHKLLVHLDWCILHNECPEDPEDSLLWYYIECGSEANGSGALLEVLQSHHIHNIPNKTIAIQLLLPFASLWSKMTPRKTLSHIAHSRWISSETIKHWHWSFSQSSQENSIQL